MSYAGILKFKKNLDQLTTSESFKKSNDGERLKMGDRLLKSKYGMFGETKELLNSRTRVTHMDFRRMSSGTNRL